MKNDISRIQKIQQALRKRKLAAALFSKPENVRYLCGYTGSNGRLLVTPKQATLITDFRYLRAARKQIPEKIKIHDQKKGAELKRLLGRFSVLGIEEGNISHRHYLAYRKLLPKTKLKDISGMVEEFRMIKDEAEMRIIRKAVSIADQAFQKLTKSIKVGDSEDDLEWRLLSFAHDLGADGFSFSPIIAFGRNTADVHHQKEPNRLKKGEMILIDMGIRYKGYMTDMTRVIFTPQNAGAIGQSRLQKIYKIVLRANQSAIKAIKVGMKLSEIDRVARGIIENEGYGPRFGHALGHGVGLEVHEAPNVSPPSPRKRGLHRAGEKSETLIRPGMVFTIEPGIYLDNLGGVRIEDMVYIRADGTAEVLTKVPKTVRVI